jgi:hypothetical protein
MNARTLALTFALVASVIAFGGVADQDLLTQDAAASCTQVDIDPFQPFCLEQAVCTAVEEVTGRPATCIE